MGSQDGGEAGASNQEEEDPKVGGQDGGGRVPAIRRGGAESRGCRSGIVDGGLGGFCNGEQDGGKGGLRRSIRSLRRVRVHAGGGEGGGGSWERKEIARFGFSRKEMGKVVER